MAFGGSVNLDRMPMGLLLRPFYISFSSMQRNAERTRYIMLYGIIAAHVRSTSNLLSLFSIKSHDATQGLILPAIPPLDKRKIFTPQFRKNMTVGLLKRSQSNI